MKEKDGLSSVRKVEHLLPGMPKKTKKEKIIAEYRRKLSVVSARGEAAKPVKEPVQTDNFPTYIPTFTLTNNHPDNEQHDAVSLDPQEFLAIKKDLMMTLVLMGCILVGQIIIWRVMG